MSSAAGDSGAQRAPEWLLRLSLVGASLVLTLIFGEIAVRIVGLGAPPPSRAENPFTFFDYHPRLGWDLVPGAEDRLQTDEMDVRIRINDQGMRADREYAASPPPDVIRVVALGDSFTFGHGVEAHEIWTSVVEKELGVDGKPDEADLAESTRGYRFEIPNLAVTGYGTDQQLLRFEAMGEELQPSVVVLGLFVGNVFRNAREQHIGYGKPRFQHRPDGLQLSNVPVPRDLQLSRPSRLLWLLGDRGRGLAEHLGKGEAWPITGAILDRLRRASEGMGARLVVVILPRSNSVHGPESGFRAYLHERSLESLRSLLEAEDLPYLDLAPAMRTWAGEHPGERLYFEVDGHWNAEGHRVAASHVLPWLRQHLQERGIPGQMPAEPGAVDMAVSEQETSP